MGAADPGADEAAGLDAGGQCREHALTHRPPDPRHEHHPALPQGHKRDLHQIETWPDLLFDMSNLGIYRD